MVRTIIQLTEDQAKRLKERARKQRVSVSELVREGVDMVLKLGISDEELRRRAKEAVGFIRDVPDLSVNHDKYLAEAYAEKASE
ncbi:MAG: ribbon-helix-helix domain-containing protein [Armatimonadota bacterium]|nr:ribbon-helix-helix domain-containing protein [Armatimonadota bacterium]